MASEYGWAKQEILEQVYFDDFYYLHKAAQKRKRNDYKMQLAINENPHREDPASLWRMLDEQSEYDFVKQTDPDLSGLTALKKQLGNGGGFGIK